MAPITYKQTEPAVLADGEADAHHAYASGMLADGQDCAAMAAGRWGNRLAALVVNAVPPYGTDAVAPSVAKSAAGGGAVVVPRTAASCWHRRWHRSPITWTLEPVSADATVERFLIGGNIMGNGPTYYGRYAN